MAAPVAQPPASASSSPPSVPRPLPSPPTMESMSASASASPSGTIEAPETDGEEQPHHRSAMIIPPPQRHHQSLKFTMIPPLPPSLPLPATKLPSPFGGDENAAPQTGGCISSARPTTSHSPPVVGLGRGPTPSQTSPPPSGSKKAGHSQNLPRRGNALVHRPVLRRGECLEDVFGMSHVPELAADLEYVRLCRHLADRRSWGNQLFSSSQGGNGPAAGGDDARTWKIVLERAAKAVRNATPENAKPSDFLLKLHRRAASRDLRPTHGLDALEVWISYASCQVSHGLVDDARMSLLHVQPKSPNQQPSFPEVARYYLVRAEVEDCQGRTSAARDVLLQGLARGAQPREDLERRLAHYAQLEEGPGRQLGDEPDSNKADPSPSPSRPPESFSSSSSPLSNKKRPRDPSFPPTGPANSPKRSKLSAASEPQCPSPGAIAAQPQRGVRRRPLATLAEVLSQPPSSAPTCETSFAASGTSPSGSQQPALVVLPMRRRPSWNLDASVVIQLPALISTPEQMRKTPDDLKAPPAATTDASHPSSAGRHPVPPAEQKTPGRPPLAQRTSSSSKSHSKLSAAAALRRPLLMQARPGGRSGSLGLPQRVDPQGGSSLFAEEDEDEAEETECDDAKEDIASGSQKPTESIAVTAEESTTRSSDSNGKTPPRKVQLDISYMWDWDPLKPRRRSSSTTNPNHAQNVGDSGGSSTPAGKGSADIQRDEPLADIAENIASVPTPDTPGRQVAAPSSRAPPSPNEPPSDSAHQREVRRDSTTATAASVPRPALSSDDAAALLAKTNLDFLPLVRHDNILKVNGLPYVKLGVIGKGGSCKVYRALSKDCSVVAIKKVKLAGMDQKAIGGYANEIALLKRLRGNPAIIKMYDSEVDLKRKAIFVVMEQGEADLNHVLQQQMVAVPSGGRRHLNMNFVRLTWHQMLSAVHCIHEARIIHGDLKPANFLFVKGALKLIDFGIAKAIQNDDTTNIYRESQIGTLNYMSPEAICDTGTGHNGGLRMKIGRASDVWSLGCILYQMIYGRTPFADLHIVQKLQAIVNPNHVIPFPHATDEAAIDAMKQCLRRKPEDRPPIVGAGGLLNEHRFLVSARPHPSHASAPN